MDTFFIGYDLNKTGQDYSTLIEKIKSLGTWWHCLDSTWFVKCNSTTANIRDFLKAYIDSNDELLVMKVTSANWASWGLEKTCSDWFHTNL